MFNQLEKKKNNNNNNNTKYTHSFYAEIMVQIIWNIFIVKMQI